MGKLITGVSFKAAGAKGVTLTYDNFDSNGPLGDTKKNYKNVPHKDFDEALQKLKVHALFISEFMLTGKFKTCPVLDVDDPVAKDFRVCGVHINGSADTEGFIITVYRTLSTGKGYVYNTPLEKVENEGDSAYKFMEQLMNDVEDVKKAAEEYLQGKFGVKQGELFEVPEEAPESVGE